MTPHPENASWRILILLFSYFRVRKVKAFFPLFFLVIHFLSHVCDSRTDRKKYIFSFLHFLVLKKKKKEFYLKFIGEFSFQEKFFGNVSQLFFLKISIYFLLENHVFQRNAFFFLVVKKFFLHFLLLIWKTKTKKMFFFVTQEKKQHFKSCENNFL